MNFCMGAFREIIGEMRNGRILGDDYDKFLNRMCRVLISYFLIAFFSSSSSASWCNNSH